MATLSTNTIVDTRPINTALARLIAALRPAPKTAEDHLAAQQRLEAARAQVDQLLR